MDTESKPLPEIVFKYFVYAEHANPNKDPSSPEGMPRLSSYHCGLISQGCMSHSIRMQLRRQGKDIFCLSGKDAGDGMNSLEERARKRYGRLEYTDIIKRLCSDYEDVRLFGTPPFPYKDINGNKINVSVAATITFGFGESINTITLDPPENIVKETKEGKKFFVNHYVESALYEVTGGINLWQAQKVGLTTEDIEDYKNCLPHLFDKNRNCQKGGVLQVSDIFWWQMDPGEEHSFMLFDSVSGSIKEGVSRPQKYDDYIITIDESNIAPEHIHLSLIAR